MADSDCEEGIFQNSNKDKNNNNNNMVFNVYFVFYVLMQMFQALEAELAAVDSEPEQVTED